MENIVGKWKNAGNQHICPSGFCPEIKFIGTNGPLILKKVGHFRKYGALVNPFPNDNFYTHPNCKSLQKTILNLMNMAESSAKDYKTMWEKEKLLVTSHFSFSYSVFKRLVLQTCKARACLGKG